MYLHDYVQLVYVLLSQPLTFQGLWFLLCCNINSNFSINSSLRLSQVALQKLRLCIRHMLQKPNDKKLFSLVHGIFIHYAFFS